ncbi:MAG: regulatory protein GemA [Cyanobacteriota bacterium]|nr:regulatory protein GemA [Cyanobacteriota bacterium]
MATPSQIKRIHILKSLLGLDDDLYREMLMSFGVCSSKDLTFTEASVMLDILETRAEERNLWKRMPKPYEDLNRDSKMATPPQLRMIKGLWREICYFDNNEFANKSLRKFLKSKFKVDDINFLTKTKAIKVIQAIKAIKQKLEKSAAAL